LLYWFGCPGRRLGQRATRCDATSRRYNIAPGEWYPAADDAATDGGEAFGNVRATIGELCLPGLFAPRAHWA
jgi:hypothetical protein